MVSKTGAHQSVCDHNKGTGGYNHIKGIQRGDGKKPTHCSDKQHPDTGASAHKAGHLPLQTATVLSLKDKRRAAELTSGTETAHGPASGGLSPAQPSGT